MGPHGGSTDAVFLFSLTISARLESPRLGSDRFGSARLGPPRNTNQQKKHNMIFMKNHPRHSPPAAQGAHAS
jgi:hypothetical protein